MVHQFFLLEFSMSKRVISVRNGRGDHLRDEDWTNIKIGGSLTDPTKDFTTQGAYLQTNFSNIDDPATRTLNSITMGATSATGDISAAFNKLQW